MLKRLIMLSLTTAFITVTSHADNHDAGHSQDASKPYEIKTVVSGLPSSWAMAFLPNGDLLVTQRSGELRVVRNGRLLDARVSGIPDVFYAGQGGLLDVMLDQDFADNKIIYLSFSHGTRSANATRLIAATLVDSDTGYALDDVRILFTASPMKSTAHHHAARIAQMADGSLLLSVGDGFNYREQAQTLDNHFGKIIRINQDGTVPDDNPFVANEKALPEIYSIGHRNQQGLIVSDGKIIEHEHGPRGGDEVNIIEPGKNYGWPIATFGTDYNGAQISPFTSYEGMVSPLVNWTPSIAPSSMTAHKGHFYVTSLAEQSIRKLMLDGNTFKDQGVVYPQLKRRMRDIVSGPDGYLYVLTDGGNAEIVKIIE